MKIPQQKPALEEHNMTPAGGRPVVTGSWLVHLHSWCFHNDINDFFVYKSSLCQTAHEFKKMIHTGCERPLQPGGSVGDESRGQWFWCLERLALIQQSKFYCKHILKWLFWCSEWQWCICTQAGPGGTLHWVKNKKRWGNRWWVHHTAIYYTQHYKIISTERAHHKAFVLSS